VFFTKPLITKFVVTVLTFNSLAGLLISWDYFR